MTELHEAARRYLGVRWVHRGRTESELDCVGLGVVAAQDLGWEVLDRDDYSRRPLQGQLEAQLQANFGPPVLTAPFCRKQLQPNDVVAMRFAKNGRVRHVGIVGKHPEGGLSLIHTDSAIGRVVEQRIDQHLLARIASVYRRSA